MSILLFFLLVTLSHAFCLFLVKFNKVKDKSVIWSIHYFVNGILWLLLLGWIILIQLSPPTVNFSNVLKLTGAIICVFGLFLVIVSFQKISLKQAMGYRFFSKTKINWVSSGVYKFLANPMYDGFVLIFLGLGFLDGVVINFYLSLSSLLFLNIFLAAVERSSQQLTWRII